MTLKINVYLGPLHIHPLKKIINLRYKLDLLNYESCQKTYKASFLALKVWLHCLALFAPHLTNHLKLG